MKYRNYIIIGGILLLFIVITLGWLVLSPAHRVEITFTPATSSEQTEERNITAPTQVSGTHQDTQANSTHQTKISVSAHPYTNPQTEEEILRKKNHEELLSARYEITMSRKQISSKEDTLDVNMSDIERWAGVLYKDTILAHLLDETLSDSEKNVLSHEFEQPYIAPDLELIGEVIPKTSKYYSAKLRELLTFINENKGVNLSNAYIEDLTMRLNDFMFERKHASNGYYGAEIGGFLLSDAHDLQQKISYMDPFILAKDWDLVEYGIVYSLRLSEENKSLTPEEKKQIAVFLHKAKTRE